MIYFIACEQGDISVVRAEKCALKSAHGDSSFHSEAGYSIWHQNVDPTYPLHSTSQNPESSHTGFHNLEIVQILKLVIYILTLNEMQISLCKSRTAVSLLHVCFKIET